MEISRRLLLAPAAEKFCIHKYHSFSAFSLRNVFLCISQGPNSAYFLVVELCAVALVFIETYTQGYISAISVIYLSLVNFAQESTPRQSKLTFRPLLQQHMLLQFNSHVAVSVDKRQYQEWYSQAARYALDSWPYTLRLVYLSRLSSSLINHTYAV